MATKTTKEKHSILDYFAELLDPRVSDHVKLGKSEHRRTLSPPSGFIKFTLQAETVYNAGISRTHQVSMLTLLPPTQARNNEAT